MKAGKLIGHGCVNKYNYLNSDSYHHDIIKLSRIHSHIDRIQFSVKYSPITYNVLLKHLENNFNHCKTFKVNHRLIKRFDLDTISIQVVRNFSSQNDFAEQWVQVSISNPSDDVQRYFADLFHDIFPETSKSVSLRQVEFATDFYPEDPDDLFDLRMILQSSIYLRYSREKSSKKVKTTLYQGKNGNVREGSKGLRIYPKYEYDEKFVRVELHAMRPFLKNNNFDISSLPIHSDDIDIYSFIDFRSGLTSVTRDKFVESLMNKCFPKTVRHHKYPDKYNPSDSFKYRGIKAAQCRLANFIHSDCGDNPAQFFPKDYDVRPVADQINAFKRIKDENELSLQDSTLFPNISQQVINDLQNGFICRRYLP